MEEDIHSVSAQVIVSSHPLCNMTTEEVVKYSVEHFHRGADVSKLVATADSEKELLDAI